MTDIKDSVRFEVSFPNGMSLKRLNEIIAKKLFDLHPNKTHIADSLGISLNTARGYITRPSEGIDDVWFIEVTE